MEIDSAGHCAAGIRILLLCVPPPATAPENGIEPGNCHLRAGFTCEEIDILQVRAEAPVERDFASGGGLVVPVPPEPVGPLGRIHRFPCLESVPLLCSGGWFRRGGVGSR